MSSESPEKLSVSPKNVEPEEKSSTPIGNGDIQNSSSAIGRKISAAEIVDRFIIPKLVRRRIKALRKIQSRTSEIESEFQRRSNELQAEFAKRVVPLRKTRKEIVAGEREPTVEECEIELEYDEATFAKKLEYQVSDYEVAGAPRKELAYYCNKGVPHYWLFALLNGKKRGVSMLIECSTDDMILTHLVDIEVVYSYKPRKFVLNFHFAKNEYFTNECLSKEFIVEPRGVGAKLPFDFDDDVEIVEAKRCSIDWKPGKDVTKDDGEECPSFFQFFEEPRENKLSERWSFEYQCEVAEKLRRIIIPKATLYYTREIGNFDESDVYEEEEADADEEEEDTGEMVDSGNSTEETDKESEGEWVDDDGNEEPPKAAKDKRTK